MKNSELFGSSICEDLDLSYTPVFTSDRVGAGMFSCSKVLKLPPVAVHSDHVAWLHLWNVPSSFTLAEAPVDFPAPVPWHNPVSILYQ